MKNHCRVIAWSVWIPSLCSLISLLLLNARSLSHLSKRIQAILGNGLTRVDLIRCWVAWRVIPLSRRSKLMYEYDTGPYDSLCYSSVQLTEEDVVAMSTILVNGKYEDCSKVGLNPFCKLNPAPKVKIPDLFLFLCFPQ